MNNVGDYVHRTTGIEERLGKPLQASTKDGHLSAIRRFFTDCQEWEWLPRRFDPGRALATPRSITALLGPNNVVNPTMAGLIGEFGLWPLIDKQLAVISDAMELPAPGRLSTMIC